MRLNMNLLIDLLTDLSQFMNCLIKTLQSYMLSAMEVIISVPKDLNT